jgi:hypothetical protein
MNFIQYFQIPLFVLDLTIGIYTSIIMSNNKNNNISSEITAFVLIICIIHLLSASISILKYISDKHTKLNILPFITIGLFIWSCVILFSENIIYLKSQNPYFMVIFVYFILNIIVLGTIVITLPFIGCYLSYKIGLNKNNKNNKNNNFKINTNSVGTNTNNSNEIRPIQIIEVKESIIDTPEINKIIPEISEVKIENKATAPILPCKNDIDIKNIYPDINIIV